MRKTLIAAAVLMALHVPAQAESWSAHGILVLKPTGEPLEIKFVKMDDFETYNLCMDAVMAYSHTREFIGKGGTNNQIPTVHWNFDGDCRLKRH